MKDFIPGLVIGFLVGVAITLVLLAVTPPIANKAHKALDTCQSTLPRDQHCILTAVPKIPEGQ